MFGGMLKHSFSVHWDWRESCFPAWRCETRNREASMLALLSLITLILATCLAAAAAVALNWLLLHTALRLMRPATARQVTVRHELVRGTVRLARALAPRGPAA